jgi:hypothetical protein
VIRSVASVKQDRQRTHRREPPESCITHQRQQRSPPHRVRRAPAGHRRAARDAHERAHVPQRRGHIQLLLVQPERALERLRSEQAAQQHFKQRPWQLREDKGCCCVCIVVSACADSLSGCTRVSVAALAHLGIYRPAIWRAASQLQHNPSSECGPPAAWTTVDPTRITHSPAVGVGLRCGFGVTPSPARIDICRRCSGGNQCVEHATSACRRMTHWTRASLLRLPRCTPPRAVVADHMCTGALVGQQQHGRRRAGHHDDDVVAHVATLAM